MKIGKYKLSVIETGTIGLDGGAMFGVVPKVLWQRSNPADEMNRVTLAARNLLLESDNRKILIDTGIGTSWDEKFMKIYSVDQTKNSLFDSLKQKNVDPSDITDVILTHLHFDHVGGAVIFDEDKALPAFPNAKYFVRKKQFEWANNPSDRDKGSFVENRFKPLYEEGVLALIDEGKEFDDSIDLIEVNGHTFSQQLVKISDSSKTLFYCADLIPFVSHLHIPFVMGFDLQPLITVLEKKEYLYQAVEENWYLFFEHDPKVVTATVELTEKGYRAKETFAGLPID